MLNSTRFRTPPVTKSPEKIVAFVPSVKVSDSIDQSSTSCGRAAMNRFSTSESEFVTSPTSQTTLSTPNRSPRARASAILRKSAAESG